MCPTILNSTVFDLYPLRLPTPCILKSIYFPQQSWCPLETAQVHGAEALLTLPTVAEVPSAHLQEGEGQGVLTVSQQRFTFIQRFIVQCNTIDLGPKRELVRPINGVASGSQAARPGAGPICQSWDCLHKEPNSGVSKGKEGAKQQCLESLLKQGEYNRNITLDGTAGGHSTE